MSRWLSPQKAARLAERTATQARRERKDKIKSRLMIVGVALLMLVTYAAWIVINARLRHYRHHHHEQKPVSQSRTNSARLFAPDTGWTLAKVEFETEPVRP